MNKIISLIVFTSIFAFSCGATVAEPLQGKVEASTELPAIPPELRAGRAFKDENLPAMGTSQGWYWIPSWFAGTWHREVQTNFTPIGPKTELSRSLDEHQTGEQVDRNGGIWVHFSLPKKDTVEDEQTIEYQIITYSEPILTNETQIVGRYRALTIQVSKRNGKIVRVSQKEQFDTKRSEGQGAVFQDAWLTVYNERGIQLGSQQVQTHYYQIRPFKPIDIDPETGLDLRQDFKAYLMSHGLANLVPVDEPAQISKTGTSTY